MTTRALPTWSTQLGKLKVFELSRVVTKLNSTLSNSEHDRKPDRAGGKRKIRWAVVIVATLLIASALLARSCGTYLIVDNPEKSDVILVPAGGLQQRYDKALQLIRDGYGNFLIADVAVVNYFGHAASDLASEYFGSLPESNKVQICRIALGVSETVQAGECLKARKPNSILIVTSEFQTRRALEHFSHDLPQYRWTVTSAQGHKAPSVIRWWASRSIRRAVYFEWTRLLWWELVERWAR